MVCGRERGESLARRAEDYACAGWAPGIIEMSATMRVPSDRPIRGVWLYLGLTLASALAAHLIFDALDDGLIAVVSRPLHLAYLLVVGVAFALAWRDLAGGHRAERRRRLALARSAVMRSRRRSVFAACVLQIGLAATTLMLEGAAFGGPQLVFAVAAALLAVLAGALALRSVERRILGLVDTVFISPRPPRDLRCRRAGEMLVRIAVERLYFLFVPKRPPPTFA